MVALQTNEIDHHGKGLLGVRSDSTLNALGQVGEELVATLEDTQANERPQVGDTQVVEDLGGQSFSPNINLKAQIQRVVQTRSFIFSSFLPVQNETVGNEDCFKVASVVSWYRETLRRETSEIII